MKKLILPLITLLILSCNKKDDEEPIIFKDKLPEISSVGANTFGVIIDNTTYLPKSSINDINNLLYPTYSGVSLSASDKKMSCIIHTESKNETLLFLYINDDSGLKTNEYIVNGQDIYNIPGRVTIEYTLFKNASETANYRVVPNSGAIKINKNDKDIISGTFNCKLVNEKNSNDIIEVKEGRFDLNKNTINDFEFPKKEWLS
jgi:hypothetical protein